MIDFAAMTSPILLRGDAVTAYRDPAAYYLDGKLYLFFTLTETEPDGNPYSYVAGCVTDDLIHFSPVRKFTCRDRRFNFSSPGSIVRTGNKYVLCCQSYCRENGEKFGNQRCRLYFMRSADLLHWTAPEQFFPMGPDVPDRQTGRMIDPFVLADPKGGWWCFFKQNGISLSRSMDLKSWDYCGHIDGGENVSALYDERGECVVWHSPANGIGVKRGPDPLHLKDEPGVLTLGQREWPWARGRLTAGFVLDLRGVPAVGKAILLFHGSGPEDETVCFDHDASIGFAWSDDLKIWNYAGQEDIPASGVPDSRFRRVMGPISGEKQND